MGGAIWKGLVLGFSIAAPLGPIGLLCIKRTLEGDRWRGIISGLGAASADAFYGTLAAFGLAAFFQHFTWIQNWTQLLGGLFIVYLGLRFALTKSLQNTERVSKTSSGLGKVYLTTFLLTLSNPMTIFAFLGMFAGAGVSSSSSAGWMVAGIFTGSMLWWITLAFLTHWLGQRMNAKVLLWVNRTAGIVLVAFGLWSAVGAAMKII
jgi:threonine/homoserine/homoserine lactone efflux protein